MVIFDGLYSISEDEVGSWLVYFKYINILATNSIILEEHKEDVTNKQFVEQFISRIKEFTDDLEEHVLFHKKTDEQVMQEEVAAIQEQENEQAMEAQINGN
jgi:vacuolar-type H+-ATPase catalytic subunit A/Vma1